MRVGSLFTGIGGFDLAFEREGFEVTYQCEVNRFCNRVLFHHWPDVSNVGDITQVQGMELPYVDVLCGGFPCQDVSMAGRRAGLAGERSGLFFEFARILGEAKPEWFVLENVSGLLSSNKGRDMGTILGTLAELGYGFAYRVLDSQNFGVPQHRERVFIVGHLGDWDGPRKVLCESESSGGDFAAGEETPATVTLGVGGDPYEARNERTIAKTLNNSSEGLRTTDIGSGAFIIVGERVRRMTLLEWERAQSFPEGWTAIDGDKTPDSPRYRALGNAVTVNVAQWIARRIMLIHRKEAVEYAFA